MDQQHAPKSGYPRKRARTRRQLMTAGMAVLAEHGPDGTTLGQVARRAMVSPGTVYNHFGDLTGLIQAIVDELASGVEISRAQLDEIEHDPAARVAIGTRQLLELTVVDPPTAHAFVTLLATVPPFRTRVRTTVAGAIRAGIERGRFVERDVDLVADACLGAAVQWMRSRLQGDTPADVDGSLDEHLRMVLLIAGLPVDEIDAAVAAAVTGAIAG